jgi:hypothetical protein
MTDNGLLQMIKTSTRGCHILDVFLTNRIDLDEFCTVMKSCLSSDQLALVVNCTTNVSSACKNLQNSSVF